MDLAMTGMITYMIENLVCSGILFACYTILLERRVHFAWCRGYLLLATAVAAIIPLLRIPVWAGKEIIQVPTPQPVEMSEETALEMTETVSNIAIEPIIGGFYGVGVALIIGAMVWQVLRMKRLRREAICTKEIGYVLVRTRQKITSFSFLRRIYVWQGVSDEELLVIVAHELSHIRHRHSVERIIMECMKALQWWNPFVWVAARWLTEVEEFEADNEVLTSGYDMDDYMKILLKQLFGYSPEIANGLRNSLTKKRFQMMKTDSMSRYALLRVVCILPVVAGLLSLFSFTAKADTVVNLESETEMNVAGNSTPKSVDEVIAQVIVRANGKELPGAIVSVAGTTRGAVTDLHGKVELKVPIATTLEISYIGHKKRELKVDLLNEVTAVKMDKSSLITVTYHVDLDAEVKPATTSSNPNASQKVVELKAGTKTAMTTKQESSLRIVEVMPTFQGGSLLNYRTWVQSHVRYPAEALKRGIEGRVVAEFVVDKEGSVCDVRILRQPDKLLGDEARRVLELTPAGSWTSGKQRGEAVRVKYTLPIDFRIPNNGEKSAETDTRATPEKNRIDEIVVTGYGPQHD